MRALVVLVLALALPAAATAGIHVSGNRLVDDAGHTVRLLGVNRSGAEYACVQGWGLFDGPRRRGVDRGDAVVARSTPCASR